MVGRIKSENGWRGLWNRACDLSHIHLHSMLPTANLSHQHMGCFRLFFTILSIQWTEPSNQEFMAVTSPL